MSRRARCAARVGAGMAAFDGAHLRYRSRYWLLLILIGISACNQAQRSAPAARVNPWVVAVAPVLNLSGSQDFDPLKVTDLIASEFLEFDNIAVVPINLTLAELERRGKLVVETPEEALDLARRLGADAAVVVAVTEYDPYWPPVIGLVMQWYAARPMRRAGEFDPVAASRNGSDVPYALSGERVAQPVRQVQRVFNSAREDVRKEVRDYAKQREGAESPYGWQRYLHSQELYVRYCGWALIRTMLLLDANDVAAVEPHEAKL